MFIENRNIVFEKMEKKLTIDILFSVGIILWPLCGANPSTTKHYYKEVSTEYLHERLPYWLLYDDLGEKTNLISFHMHLHYIQQYVYFIFSLFPMILIYLWYYNYILLKYFHFKDTSKYQIDIFKYATFIKYRKEKCLEIPKEIDEQHKRIMTCAKRINVCHI